MKYVVPGGVCHAVRRTLQHQLGEDYGITHGPVHRPGPHSH
ncbi:hypothetical protein [Streptomyces sp. Inha503]